MVQLILKNEVAQSKLDALLYFLRSWDIDAEIKVVGTPIPKDKSEFSLSAGIWKDNPIDAEELRKQAWKIN